MGMTNNERQTAWRNRQKIRSMMELDLGDDLEDGIPVERGTDDPLSFMLKIMNDPNQPMDLRTRMAQAAAPYCHAKIEAAPSKTKKEEKQDAADEASNGMFAPAAPPKLAMVN